MKLKYTKTERNFSLITFTDLYKTECSIQKSSLANKDAIWFGVDNPKPQILGVDGWQDIKIDENIMLSTRMHLTRNQVSKLLPILQKFVDTGEITNN